MRKSLIIIIGALLAVVATSCESCSGPQGGVSQAMGDNDTTQMADSVLEVTGVAVDGAMNSVALLVGEDTVFFSYPELEAEHRGSWEIGDTVTVRYAQTQNGDSVTDVICSSDVD